MRVALATCEPLPVPDRDLELLLPALAEREVEAEAVAWSDPDADWASFNLVQLSSTWDYHERLVEFRAWLGRIEGLTRLENPRELVEWNLDKRYLADLADAGVPTVPTIWAEPDEADEAQEEVAENAWGQVVVKPAVDLGAQRLRRVGPGEVAGAVDAAGRPRSVQPSARWSEPGELSLVYFRGGSPRDPEDPASGDFGSRSSTAAPTGSSSRRARPPRRGEGDRAARLGRAGAADTLPGTPPLYGRVDLVGGPDGELCVIELELIEPSFYLDVAGPQATERFADLLVETAGDGDG